MNTSLVYITNCSECAKSLKDTRPRLYDRPVGYIFCKECSERHSYIHHLNSLYNGEKLDNE